MYCPSEPRSSNVLHYKAEPITIDSSHLQRTTNQKIVIIREQTIYQRILNRQRGVAAYTTTPVTHWSVADVVAWMQDLPLLQDYTEVILTHGIDGKALLELKAKEWLQMGVNVFGDRKLLTTQHPRGGRTKLSRPQRAGAMYCLGVIQSYARAYLSNLHYECAKEKFFAKYVRCGVEAALVAAGVDKGYYTNRKQLNYTFLKYCRNVFCKEVMSREYARRVVRTFVLQFRVRCKIKWKRAFESDCSIDAERAFASLCIENFCRANGYRHAHTKRRQEERNKNRAISNLAETHYAATVVQCWRRKLAAQRKVKELTILMALHQENELKYRAATMIQKFYLSKHTRQCRRQAKAVYHENTLLLAGKQVGDFIASVVQQHVREHFSLTMVALRVDHRAAMLCQQALRMHLSCKLADERCRLWNAKCTTMCVEVSRLMRQQLSSLVTHYLTRTRYAVILQVLLATKRSCKYTWIRRIRRRIKVLQAFSRGKQSAHNFAEKQKRQIQLYFPRLVLSVLSDKVRNIKCERWLTNKLLLVQRCCRAKVSALNSWWEIGMKHACHQKQVEVDDTDRRSGIEHLLLVRHSLGSAFDVMRTVMCQSYFHKIEQSESVMRKLLEHSLRVGVEDFKDSFQKEHIRLSEMKITLNDSFGSFQSEGPDEHVRRPSNTSLAQRRASRQLSSSPSVQSLRKKSSVSIGGNRIRGESFRSIEDVVATDLTKSPARSPSFAGRRKSSVRMTDMSPKRQTASRVIQRACRQWLAFRKREKLKRQLQQRQRDEAMAERYAAIQIQAVWRGTAARRTREELMREFRLVQVRARIHVGKAMLVVKEISQRKAIMLEHRTWHDGLVDKLVKGRLHPKEVTVKNHLRFMMDVCSGVGSGQVVQHMGLMEFLQGTRQYPNGALQCLAEVSSPGQALHTTLLYQLRDARSEVVPSCLQFIAKHGTATPAVDLILSLKGAEYFSRGPLEFIQTLNSPTTQPSALHVVNQCKRAASLFGLLHTYAGTLPCLDFITKGSFALPAQIPDKLAHASALTIQKAERQRQARVAANEARENRKAKRSEIVAHSESDAMEWVRRAVLWWREKVRIRTYVKERRLQRELEDVMIIQEYAAQRIQAVWRKSVSRKQENRK
eukprot:PhF_6_TR31814/c1_g1_i1/m.46975